MQLLRQKGSISMIPARTRGKRTSRRGRRRNGETQGMRACARFAYKIGQCKKNLPFCGRYVDGSILAPMSRLVRRLFFFYWRAAAVRHHTSRISTSPVHLPSSSAWPRRRPRKPRRRGRGLCPQPLLKSRLSLPRSHRLGRHLRAVPRGGYPRRLRRIGQLPRASQMSSPEAAYEFLEQRGYIAGNRFSARRCQLGQHGGLEATCLRVPDRTLRRRVTSARGLPPAHATTDESGASGMASAGHPRRSCR